MSGRWTRPDPLGYAAGDANLYRYANNQPANFTDPSGTTPAHLLTGLVGAVVGGVVGGVAAGLSGDRIWVGAWVGAAAGGLIGLTWGLAAAPGLTVAGVGGTALVAGGATAGGLDGAATAANRGGNVYAGAAVGAGLGALSTAPLAGGAGALLNGGLRAATGYGSRRFVAHLAVRGGLGLAQGAGETYVQARANPHAGVGGWDYVQNALRRGAGNAVDPTYGAYGSVVGSGLGAGAGYWASGWHGAAVGMGLGEGLGGVAGGGLWAALHPDGKSGAWKAALRVAGLEAAGALAGGGLGYAAGGWGGVAAGAGYGRMAANLALLHPKLRAALLAACFGGETPLRTPDGDRRIDQLRVGDRVLARDEFDPAGAVAPKVVEEVFVRSGQVLHLHVRGRVIRTTAEHPFWVYNKGWTAAGDLAVGDRLAGLDRWVAVEDLLDTGEVETVYNVRISDYHTYFVGCSEWGFSVWAHNACVLTRPC